VIGNQLEPSSGSDYDQQGWWVYEHEIEIVNIVVTHPNDSEVFEIGSIESIDWTCSIAGAIDIDLIKGQSFSMEIASSIPNTGHFDWEVPLSILPANDYKIEVRSSEFPDVSDWSYNTPRNSDHGIRWRVVQHF